MITRRGEAFISDHSPVRKLFGLSPTHRLVLALLFALAPMRPSATPAQTLIAGTALPDAPEPQVAASSTTPAPPCPAPKSNRASTGSTPQSLDPTPRSPHTQRCLPAIIRWYPRFLKGPQDKSLTVQDKAWLATRNVLDPFNGITILGEAGISVAADSHSPYGPGMPGYARYVGVSYTEDLTGEFFASFLIPSIAHQDPRYHRLPNASIPHRIAHTFTQVVWTQGDNGRGMPNYGDIVGGAIMDEVDNLYVPGRETNLPASATRYAIGLATAPIGNVISEFLPDVASHIHIQIVVLQRIINQVARSETNNAQ